LKFEEEGRSVKDVFQWDDRELLDKKKAKIQQLTRSPDRWATEQRDRFRYFVDSPGKKGGDGLNAGASGSSLPTNIHGSQLERIDGSDDQLHHQAHSHRDDENKSPTKNVRIESAEVRMLFLKLIEEERKG
jgi:hypothetical protein